jgi:hypothetical protein
MRRLLTPTVALLTFFIGVAATMLWVAVNRIPGQIWQTETAVAAVPAASVALPQAEPESEKYAVYAALIREMHLGSETKLAVIVEDTGCVKPSESADAEKMRDDEEKYAFKGMPELLSETLDDFHYQSKQCRTLSWKFELPVKYVLVSEKKIRALFDKGIGRWDVFYARYPNSNGFIRLSNVGFNREMNQALVNTSKSCGGLCGAGYYVLLKKEQGIWKVNRQVNTWVS